VDDLVGIQFIVMFVCTPDYSCSCNEKINVTQYKDMPPDFESIIANQRILFETGRPATPNTPVRFATTSGESTTGPTTSPNTPVTFVTTSQEPTTGPTTGPTAGPSPEIDDEDEDNKLMIIAGVSLCVCMIVVAAIFMMKR